MLDGLNRDWVWIEAAFWESYTWQHKNRNCNIPVDPSCIDVRAAANLYFAGKLPWHDTKHNPALDLFFVFWLSIDLRPQIDFEQSHISAICLWEESYEEHPYLEAEEDQYKGERRNRMEPVMFWRDLDSD